MLQSVRELYLDMLRDSAYRRLSIEALHEEFVRQAHEQLGIPTVAARVFLDVMGYDRGEPALAAIWKAICDHCKTADGWLTYGEIQGEMLDSIKKVARKARDF